MKLTLEQRVERLEQKLYESSPREKALTVEQISQLYPEAYEATLRAMRAVCAKANLPLKAMRWVGRTKHLAHWRQVAMFLAFETSGLSSQDVATMFNKKNHSTILHAYKVVPNRISKGVLRSLRSAIKNEKISCT